MRKTDSILIDAQMTRISDKHLNGNIWNKCSNQSWNCYCTKLQHTIISDKHLYILAPRYTPFQALYGHPGGAITLVYLAHWAQDFLDQPRPLDQWKDSGRTFKRISYTLDETCIDTCWLDIFQTFDVPLRFSSAQSTRPIDQLKQSECTFTSLLFMLATHLSDVWCSRWKKVFLSSINLFVQPVTFIFAPSTASSLSAPCDALKLCKIATVQNCNCAKL